MTVKKVHVCPYTHADWAYVCYRDWHVKRYIRGFELALDLMDSDPAFTWFIDTWTDQLRPVFENRPDLIERIKPRVAEGRFGLASGHYCNPQADRIGKEAFIRQTVLGQRLFSRMFPGSAFPAGAYIDCSPGHTQLPQLMRKLGFEYFMPYRAVEAMMKRGVPRQFIWSGLDGTTIPCDHPRSYITWAQGESRHEGVKNAFLAEAKASAERGCSPVLMLFFGDFDDCLPLGEPGAEVDLTAILSELSEENGIEFVYGTPRSFSGDFLKHTEELPTVEGDLDQVHWSYWHGHSGKESLWKLRMSCDRSLCQAEVAAMQYADHYPQEALDRMWEKLFEVHSHATMWLWDRDYDEFLDWTRTTHRRADELRDGIRRQCAHRIGKTQDGDPVVLFNPLPFERDEPIEFYYALDEGGTTGFKVVDGAGEQVQTQFSRDSMRATPAAKEPTSSEYRFTVRTKVPACGYRTVYVQKDNSVAPSDERELAPKSIATDTIQMCTKNGDMTDIELVGVGKVLNRLGLRFLEVEESTANNIAHRQHTLGKEAAEKSDHLPRKDVFNACSVLNYGRIVGHSDFVASEWCVMESGPLGNRLFFTGEIAGSAAELEVFISALNGRMDCDARIYVSNPLSGYYMAVADPAFEGDVHVDIPFGVEPRDLSNEPFGDQYVERGRFKSFWGYSWADLSDGEQGVAFLSEPGQEGYRNEDGLFEHFLLKTVAPENLWGRKYINKYRLGLGFKSLKFSVVLHEGDWKAAALYREVERYRQPIAGSEPMYALTGSEADSAAGLEVTPDNVMLSGFYRDDGRIMLRIYENAGEATQTTVRLPFEVKSAVMTDLHGRDANDDRVIKCDGTTLEMPLGKWEIMTLALG